LGQWLVADWLAKSGMRQTARRRFTLSASRVRAARLVHEAPAIDDQDAIAHIHHEAYDLFADQDGQVTQLADLAERPSLCP
jgi:hypothetical protein